MTQRIKVRARFLLGLLKRIGDWTDGCHVIEHRPRTLIHAPHTRTLLSVGTIAAERLVLITIRRSHFSMRTKAK